MASPRIYSSENWANSGVDSFGPYLDITQGPLGANDNGYFLTFGSPAYNRGIVELVSTLPHGLKTGSIPASHIIRSHNFSGTTTNGSATVTGIAGGGTNILAGQLVTGPGIPANAYIATVNSSSSITLSASATASATVTLTAITALNWSHSGILPFDDEGTGYPIGSLWVTGPKSIVVVLATSATGGSVNQYITGTSQVPIFLPFLISAQRKPALRILCRDGLQLEQHGPSFECAVRVE